MVIRIKGTDIELKQTFRAHIIYEQITGNTFNPKNITDIITFFYSTVMACDKELTVTFDEFVEWLDENPEKLNEFVTWLTDNDRRQQALNPKADEEKKPTIKQPTKKKKSVK